MMTAEARIAHLRELKDELVNMRSACHKLAMSARANRDDALVTYYSTQSIAFNQVIRIYDAKIADLMKEDEIAS